MISHTSTPDNIKRVLIDVTAWAAEFLNKTENGRVKTLQDVIDQVTLLSNALCGNAHERNGRKT